MGGRGPKWMPDEDDRLRKMVACDLRHEAIARKLRRTIHSVRTRVRDLGLTKRRPAARPTKWAAAAEARLLELRDARGLDWPEIADDLSITEGACISKYNVLKSRQAIAGGMTGLARIVPDTVIADMEKRNEARLMQALGGQIFGDPPPGYSALDKRRAGHPSQGAKQCHST